jgi:simple sugar transport system ATP-binding protein
MVHQHFMLVPVMTVTENIILGVEQTDRLQFLGQLGHLDRQAAREHVRKLSHQYGLDLDPDAYIKDLPVGTQQRVEIIKSLYRQAKVLILDEPTAVLTPQEIEELFKILHSLTAQGLSVIFITHKLKEVLAIADRITVLRNGRVVGSTTPEQSTEASLAAMMVGREVILTVEKDVAEPGELILDVNDLHVNDHRGQEMVRGASFFVRSGEVLGIAGVQGNGQTELVEALTGLTHSTQGQVLIRNHDVTNASSRQIIEQGVAHIPEDRHEYGMLFGCTIADNLVLCSYYQPPFSNNGFVIDHNAVDENAKKLLEEFDIRAPSIYTQGQALSGGNQQKMVVAREFSRPIKLLIASQPTRGLDVGSIEFIHKRIIEQRDHGVAVLLVSAELDEIMSLSDRIAVMYQGQIIATVDSKDATREGLGLLMAGIRKEKV